MKTKNFLLGLGEGTIVALIFPLVLFLKSHVPEALGTKIPSGFWAFVILVVVFAVILPITNNVHKLVFAETSVPKEERAFECLGGFIAMAILTPCLLYFTAIR